MCNLTLPRAQGHGYAFEATAPAVTAQKVVACRCLQVVQRQPENTLPSHCCIPYLFDDAGEGDVWLDRQLPEDLEREVGELDGGHGGLEDHGVAHAEAGVLIAGEGAAVDGEACSQCVVHVRELGARRHRVLDGSGRRGQESSDESEGRGSLHGSGVWSTCAKGEMVWNE